MEGTVFQSLSNYPEANATTIALLSEEEMEASGLGLGHPASQR